MLEHYSTRLQNLEYKPLSVTACGCQQALRAAMMAKVTARLQE